MSVSEESSSHEAPIPHAPAGRRDHIRTGAILLFIASVIEGSVWIAQLHSSWRPNAIGVAHAVGEVVMGLFLLLFRHKAIIPTFAFLVATAAVPLVRMLLTNDEPGLLPFVVLFSFPLVLGTLVVLPWALLLIGKQTRVRYITALVVFFLVELLDVSIAILATYFSAPPRLP